MTNPWIKIFCLFTFVLGLFLVSRGPVWAMPKFLTYPHAGASSHKLQQGWTSTFDPGHNSVDYIKGTLDQSSTWVGFDVLASDAGDAYYSQGAPGWGNYVKIKHVVSGTTYYTLYAHLASSTLTPNTWVSVSRGQKIGTAGEAGSAQGVGIHLHYEFSQGSYGSGYRLDPYDIYNTRQYYPEFGGSMGPNYAWTTNPPSGPGSPPPPPPPGCSYSPGQDSSRSWLFQEAYDRNGGQARLGCATGPTFWWNGGGGWIVRQDFDGPCCGFVITHDEGRDNPIGSVPAYALGGVMGADYRNLYGYLGPLVRDPYVSSYWPGPSYEQVEFFNGLMWYDGASQARLYTEHPWVWLDMSSDPTLSLGLVPAEGGGMQLILDGLGGPDIWQGNVWGVLRRTYQAFYPPAPTNLYVSWEQYDKAHSLHFAFVVVGTDGLERWLIYSANAPNWWGTQGWVDMGTSPGYHQWTSFTRNMRADFFNEYGIEPRAVREIRIGHFVYDAWVGDHGGTVKNISFSY